MSQTLTANQQTAFNDDRIDRWIFGGALALFLASVVLIVDDRILFRNGAGSGNEPIAKLYRKDNDVRRRMETDSAFTPVQNADDMYNGDAVFTGSSSEADIVFDDGSKVAVEAGSLIVLQLSKDNPKISIEKGTISGKLAAGKKMAIMTQGGKEAELKGGAGTNGEATQVQISVERGKASQITVLSGQAELTAGGEKVNLDNLSATSIGADGKATAPTHYNIEPLTSSEQIWSAGGATEFKWKPIAGQELAEVKIEISRDRDFKSVELSKKVSGTALKAELPGEGTFFWRVTSLDGSQRSPVSRILVIKEHAPRLVGPEDGETLKVAPRADSSNNGAPMKLRWTSGSESEPISPRYEVEVYKENRESLLSKSVVAGVEMETPKLALGQYYWRVKPLDPSRKESPWSKHQSFEIVEDVPNAPVAMAPESGQRYLKKSAPAKVHFEWKTDSLSPVRHILEVSADKGFSDGSTLVLRKEIKESQFDWDAAQLGTFYWRTRSISADGSMTAFTKPAEFEVAPWEALEAPKVSSQKLEFTLGETEKVDPQNLVWGRNKAVSRYEVEIADTKDFSNPVYRGASEGNFLEWPASLRPTQNREAYFRIRGQVSETDWTAWSEPANVRLRIELAELDEPRGVSPRGGQELEVDPAKPTPLEIQWSAVEGATGYEIQVSSRSSFDAILEEARTRDPVFRLKNPTLGKTYWRVRSRNAFTQSDWAGPFAFTRVPSAELIVLPSPILISPLGRTFQRDDDEVDFRWESVEGARQYEITLMRKPGSGTPLSKEQEAKLPTVVRFRVEGTSASLPIPRDGQYTWKIRASAAVRKLGLQSPGDRSLASIAPGDPKANDKAGGASANFNLIRNPLDAKRPGFISLSTMIAPYEYRFASTLQNGSARADSSAMTISLSGELWLKPRWALGATLESTAFQIGAKNFLRSSFQLTGKHRIPVDAERGWHLAPFLGAEGRQYFEITPAQFKQFTTIGVAGGFDLRKTLTEKFSMNLRMQYFYPLAVTGLPDGSVITSESSTRNLSAGLQGYYWFRPQLGVGVGGFLDWRSISYRTPTSGANGSERIFTDGSYFYTSLMYRFGN